MKWILFVFVIVSISFLYACKKTNSAGNPGGGGNPPFTPNCTSAAINFTNDVVPIFQSVCGQSGCHNSGSTNGPGPLTTHAQINAAKSSVRASIISGFMPRNTTLSAAQKNSIICWIDAGAPNN